MQTGETTYWVGRPSTRKTMSFSSQKRIKLDILNSTYEEYFKEIINENKTIQCVYYEDSINF